MKKMFPALAAVLIALSMSAFTTATENNNKQADLYWFHYDVSTGTGSYIGEGPRTSFTVAPCNQLTGNECRRGYEQSELNNALQPNMGVQDDDANTEDIRKP